MINKRINLFAKIVKNAIFLVGLLFFILTNIQCDLINPPDNKLGTKNQMIVYRNLGTEFFNVDLNNIKINKKISINIPDSITFDSKILSTNKDYLIGSGTAINPPFDHYIIIYDLTNCEISKIFKTGLDSIGAPRMISANNQAKPSLFYFYSHLNGMYSIDFLEQTINLISSEKNYPKEFYISNSIDNPWIVISKYFPGYSNDFTELQFYNSCNLMTLDFSLNKIDLDSVNVKNMCFNDDDSYLYISYLLSQRKAVNKAGYFGCYNLSTKKLSKHRIELPWDGVPYNITYNSSRNECYLVGRNNKFWIIDVSNDNYKINRIINLNDKTQNGISKILISEEENIAYISCYDDNLIIVLDIIKGIVINKLDVELPYYIDFL